MKSRLNKVMQLAALSAATAVGLTGQTHAALYQGVWDPLFGAQFAGLGWRAYGTLNVTQSCEDDLQFYGGGGAISLNAYTAKSLGTGSCGYYGGEGQGGIRLQNVSVDFYDVNDPEVITEQLFVGTYNFGDGSEYGGSASIDGETQFLTSVDFYGLLPTAFQTSYSTRGSLATTSLPEPGYARSSLSTSSLCTAATPFTQYQYSARLGSAPAASGLQYYCTADGNLVGPTGQSQFQPSFVLRDASGNPIIQNGPAQGPGSVPEPATLALAGLALAGAAAARRRQRR
jgi:PEP-CTERM motif